MPARTQRQYGLWDSPLSPALLAEDRRLDAARFDSDAKTLVWLEGRSGKGVLVSQGEPHDGPRDLTAERSVRAEVGYAGGDFTVHDGRAYYVVHKTGRVFRQRLAGGPVEPVTPPFGFASSPTVSPDGRWLIYVHHDDRQDDRLAIVDAAGDKWPQILAEGHDFYMQPRWSPDGRRVAFMAWDHPNMPWDGTTLFLADVVEAAGGTPRLENLTPIAGNSDTAVFQPEFATDGRRLLYVSDETGWGRLAVRELSTGKTGWLTPEGVEHGTPAWLQDMRTYAVSADGRFVSAVRSERGFHRVCRIAIATGETKFVDELAEYSDVTWIVASSTGDRIALIASSPQFPPRLIEHDFQSGRTRIVCRASGETVPEGALAPCERLTWKSAGDAEAHGLFYPPASDRFESCGKPPLIVMIHGGPTSQVRAGWRSEAQFFATRGYAVLYVNYRGSTGYGRPYMLALRGNWGVCDVEDAISGKEHLAQAGLIDPDRTAIMGGSAGGFTVLQTLVEQPGRFTAGVSLYGVANQFHLASDTHKFESRYLDTMLGPLPAAAALYRQRSPAFHAEKIRDPLAVFQGGEDRVVPKQQSDEVVAALNRRGTPHEYHVYEEEGHGWRRRETIEHFYQTVEAFLRRFVIYS